MRYIVALFALVLGLAPRSAVAHDPEGFKQPTAVEVGAALMGCLGPYGNELRVEGGSTEATMRAGGIPYLNIWRGYPSGRWVGTAEHVIADDVLDPPMVLSTAWNRSMPEPRTLNPREIACFEHEYRARLTHVAERQPS